MIKILFYVLDILFIGIMEGIIAYFVFDKIYVIKHRNKNDESEE